MSELSYKYFRSTGSVVSVQWCDLGDAALRKQTFGGYINAWKAKRVGEFVYLIPAGVTVRKISNALNASLAAHDRAVLTYPHGSKADGSSAMSIRLYGKAAADQSE